MMFDKHRSHLQLQMDLLEVIAVIRQEPHLYTQIQQKMQMNPETVSRYLVEMATKGLLTVGYIPHAKVARKEYKITENGLILLHQWQGFKKLWDSLVMKQEAAVDKIRNEKT